MYFLFFGLGLGPGQGRSTRSAPSVPSWPRRFQHLGLKYDHSKIALETAKQNSEG